MSQPDVLFPGMTLTEGQFVCSSKNNYFTGIHAGNFGVFAGTPSAPLGTSIILSDRSGKVAMLPDGRLASYASPSDVEPNWMTPTGGQTCYAIMQYDGNLCVYVGDGPHESAELVFGSLQIGGRTSDFLPYPVSPDVLIQGMTLTEGQFVGSSKNNYFTGIHEGQFGVFAGTPSAPLGTSITLSKNSAKVSMLPDGRLASYANHTDVEPNWATPMMNRRCYAIMQYDGNLCVYVGDQPHDSAEYVFGSLQHGGRTSDFLPYPEWRTSQITVKSFITGQFEWCVMGPDGEGPRVHQDPGGNTGSTSTGFVSGRANGECCLRAYNAWGKYHDSGDNFNIGDPDVQYSATFSVNPMTMLSWSRKH